MSRFRDPVLRTVYRVGYRIMRVWWLVRRPRTRGVKCVLTRGGDVLLVRHTYGNSRTWELPGGGVKRGEDPGSAATREMREELGLTVSDWTFLGDLFARIDSKRDHLWCFTNEIDDHSLELDAAEIAEAHWFPRDRLPPESARHVARISAMGS